MYPPSGDELIDHLLDDRQPEFPACSLGQIPKLGFGDPSRTAFGGLAADLVAMNYFVGSVGGAPLSVLKQYIENQGHG